MPYTILLPLVVIPFEIHGLFMDVAFVLLKILVPQFKLAVEMLRWETFVVILYSCYTRHYQLSMHIQ
jgi:hypothetical protein